MSQYINIYDKGRKIGYIVKTNIDINEIHQTGYVPIYNQDMESGIIDGIIRYIINTEEAKVKPSKKDIDNGEYIPIYNENILVGVIKGIAPQPQPHRPHARLERLQQQPPPRSRRKRGPN
jgi:hypothetical protein